MPATNSDIIYHYCSPETFLSVIQHSSLWLSDVLKSNDSEEESWIRKRIDDRIGSVLATIDSAAYQACSKVSGAIAVPSATIYAACFSEAKDCLSQWRGYAQDGKGFAIGFSMKQLKQVVRPYCTAFGQVIYNPQKQEKFIEKVVKENLKNMQHKSVGHCSIELYSNYSLQFPFYKNPSFAEEKEWRIIFPSYSYSKKAIRVGDFKFSPPKFKTTGSRISSYVELDFSHIKRDFIKEIWIGPKSQTTAKDVEDLLRASEYYNDGVAVSSDGPIPIYTSSSSYR